MHKKLILEAFKKAEKERNEMGDNKPSTIHMAEDISEFIYTIEDFSLGERSFRDYRKEAEALIDKNEDINIKQLKVVNGLCKYLGFDDFKAFNKSNSTNSFKTETNYKIVLPKRGISYFLKKNKIIIITVIIVLALVIIISSLNQNRWMIWNGDHYIEVKFDTNKYNVGQLKLYKEERILYFKKVKPNCNIKFFNKSGDVKIWYGKNIEGKLEIFTSLGLHPETGKTLKPITKYMIRKYICNKFE